MRNYWPCNWGSGKNLGSTYGEIAKLHILPQRSLDPDTNNTIEKLNRKSRRLTRIVENFLDSQFPLTTRFAKKCHIKKKRQANMRQFKQFTVFFLHKLDMNIFESKVTKVI